MTRRRSYLSGRIFKRRSRTKTVIKIFKPKSTRKTKSKSWYKKKGGLIIPLIGKVKLPFKV